MIPFIWRTYITSSVIILLCYFLMPIIRKSWVVFIYALTISIESISIEYLTASSLIRISPIMLSAISITLSGAILLVAAYALRIRNQMLALFTRSYKNLALASSSLSVGIFTWYDSINRIGASKEVLMAGPLEIVVIVVLARVFLGERLNRFQYIGISIALLGFFMAVASNTGIVFHYNTQTQRISMQPAGPEASLLSEITISFGDVEAILSAFGFASGVLFLTKLTLNYSPIVVAGGSMFASGLILIGFMIVGLLLYEANDAMLPSNNISLLRQPLILVISIFLWFSSLPFIGSLSYSTGLSNIGASLTSTIGSSSILMTIIIQLVLKEFGINSHLPENIVLAIFGGIAGFVGVYLIHIPDLSISATNK